MPKYKTEIKDVVEETWDVKTFRLQKPDFKFLPGQYGLFSFPDKPEFKGESRPFTFSNSPTDEKLEITVKKMGDFTTALHEAKLGERLEFEGPMGEKLNFNERVKENVFFIAGGSGITPFMSAIRYAKAKKLPNKITLLFSNRRQEDTIYKGELDGLNGGNLKVVYTLSDKTPKDWKGETGRIDRAMVEKHVREPKGCLWYLCGPPPMMSAMKKMLSNMEIPKDKIRIEDWQLPGKND